MDITWNYTQYAAAYSKRPDYCRQAIEQMLNIANLPENAEVCDIGAGAAHLTLMLAEHNYSVLAIEPNAEMRQIGIDRSKSFDNIRWKEGIAEETGQPNKSFDFVTFGSSFNVCDSRRALIETHRILKPGRYFACMWNHRNLEDPIQSNIENIIKKNLPSYQYGSRRESPEQLIKSSNLYNDIIRIEGDVVHKQSIDDCIEAWYSHATLGNQAGPSFKLILSEIEAYLRQLKTDYIQVPYTTRIWLAKSKDKKQEDM